VPILKQRLDFVIDFWDWIVCCAESGDCRSLFVNDKLGVVPLDKVAQKPSLLGLHVNPEGMRILSVHINRTEHVELDIVLGGKLFDILWILVLLIELVAGECQDTQTVSFRVLLVHLYQLSVVYVSLPSLACHVDNDADMAAVLFHADLIAVNV